MTELAPIRAAGGLLWRTNGRRTELAIVHRSRYDDWSLPKGKLAAGEHALPGACREVTEETGYRPVVGQRLPEVAYHSLAGPKTVQYWTMSAHSGSFTPSEEVDDLVWLPPVDALDLLTYPRDAGVINDLGLTTDHRVLHHDGAVLLVRHAKAGSRASWSGDDLLRPLDPVGQEQSEQLRRVLRCFGPGQIWSADPVRCIQTVEPLAAELGLPVRIEPALSERGYAADPPGGARLVRELATTSGGPVVVCTQGGALPDIVASLADQDGLPLRGLRSRKGSTWALFFRGGRLIAADYYRDFAP
ncbi:MAG: NUDIX hydrolase [Actinobacteria bacterium]|nr:NUDIX hydrolase [Actinomycetota bacterium]